MNTLYLKLVLSSTNVLWHVPGAQTNRTRDLHCKKHTKKETQDTCPPRPHAAHYSTAVHIFRHFAPQGQTHDARKSDVTRGHADGVTECKHTMSLSFVMACLVLSSLTSSGGTRSWQACTM